jgi:hypothetical protein
MSHGKRTSKRNGRTKATTVLGVAGALSLADGASVAAVGPPDDTLTANTAVTLYEEEIFDVSLSTFYAFDNENGGARRPGLQLSQRTRRGRPRRGSGGGAEDCTGGGPTCCATCATMPGCGADLGERGRAVAFSAAVLTGSIRPIATYLEPNKTLPELEKMAITGFIDPLREFSEAVRAESERLNFGPPE